MKEGNEIMTTWELLVEAYSGVMGKLADCDAIDRRIIKTYLDMVICETAVFDDTITPEKFEEILNFIDR